jgi:hypothetical protein
VLPHDCRRFSVTQLIALGVDLSTVQKRNRHASLETTQVYALEIPESDQAAAEVMGRLLRPALLMLEAPGEGSAQHRTVTAEPRFAPDAADRQRIVDERPCPTCGAAAGELCRVVDERDKPRLPSLRTIRVERLDDH